MDTQSADIGKHTPTHPLSWRFTWFIGAILTVTVVIIHLLKREDLRAIDAQKGLPLSVEPFVCYRIKTLQTEACLTKEETVDSNQRSGLRTTCCIYDINKSSVLKH